MTDDYGWKKAPVIVEVQTEYKAEIEEIDHILFKFNTLRIGYQEARNQILALCQEHEAEAVEEERKRIALRASPSYRAGYLIIPEDALKAEEAKRSE